jgi:hypothetical protein
MSSAVAAARKRRAGSQPEPIRNISTNSYNPNITSSPMPQKSGLTLPEVISLVDKRLITLEKFMNETKTEVLDLPREPKVKFEMDEVPTFSNELVEEFNARFVLLTEEITNLKDIVMNLQSYTMSVNKVLMEERIQIISDLGTIPEDEEEQDNEDEKGEEEEEPVVNDDGMTKYGIPIPSKLPTYP